MADQGYEIRMTVDVGDKVSGKVAEAWAVGQRGGVDVSEGDKTYHNNAKYYAQLTAQDRASTEGASQAVAQGVAQAQAAAREAVGAVNDAEAAAQAAAESAATAAQIVLGAGVIMAAADGYLYMTTE